MSHRISKDGRFSSLTASRVSASTITVPQLSGDTNICGSTGNFLSFYGATGTDQQGLTGSSATAEDIIIALDKLGLFKNIL